MSVAAPVIVAGASGYIGRHVVPHLAHAGLSVLTLPGRCEPDARGFRETPSFCEPLRSGDSTTLPGSALVYLAGIAGRTRLPPLDSQDAVKFATRVLAWAQQTGVSRVVLASSIYATLEERGQTSAYGAHKLAIEALFRSRFAGELVILRLPPVYGGDDQRSAIATLWRLVGKRLPLPFGRAGAARDYLAIDNLVTLIERLVRRDPSGSVRSGAVVYEPSDGEPVSTRQLVEQIARMQGVSSLLLPLPGGLVGAFHAATGRAGSLASAFTPLRTAGNDRLRDDAGWVPSVRMPQSLNYLRGRS